MDLPPIQPQNTMKHSSNSPDKKKTNGGDYAPSPPSPTRRRASFEAASVLANLGLSSSRDAASPTIATTTTTAATDDSKLPSTNSTSTKHKYKSSPPRNDVPMTFPEKLMELLANDEYSDVVTWLPHGKGFAILKKEEFQNDVLPLYFKQSKYTSFTRKLKRWGFTRVTAGTELGAYYHKFFQRDDHLLCMQMQCQSTGPLVFNKDLHRQNKMLLAEKRKFAKMHRTSTSSQEDTDTKSSDDNDAVSSSRINGLRGESEEGRDELLGQVLQRQRELLKQEDAMFGENQFESVLEKQQQLLRAQINTSRLKREEEEMMRNTNEEQSAMISLRREQLRREQLLREQANNNSYHRPFQEQGSYLPRPNMMYTTDQRPMPSGRGMMDAGSATLRDPQAEALLGAISNSRHHRNIMENALNALKSGQSLPPAMHNPGSNLAMENAHNTSLFGGHGAPRRNYVDLTNGDSSAAAAASSYPRPPSQQSHYLEREKWQASFDNNLQKEEFLQACASRDAQFAMEAAKAKMRMQLQGGMNESRYGGGMDLNHNMPNMNAQAQLLRLARHNKSVEDALALIGKSAIHKDDHKDEEKERSPFGRAA